MSALSVPFIREALRAAPPEIPPPGPRRPLACVALVLAGAPRLPAVCLIRRAERPGDPWSGQMALPGGRADPGDASAQAVAERETEEEVGLRLEPSQLIAPLAELPVRPRGTGIPMRLAAFVYEVRGAPPALTPQAEEVAQALWVPLERVYDPASRVRHRFERDGAALDFPALGIGGNVIWGLTYRVLAELGERVGRPLPPS